MADSPIPDGPTPGAGAGGYPGLPVVLRMEDRVAVVVGGGTVGGRRALALVAAGARVTVVDPHPGGSVEALAADGAVVLHRRPVDPVRDIADAHLVVAATDDPGVNERVAAAAGATTALVSRADDAAVSEVLFPAMVRHGPLEVAVSTSGAAPGVAAWAAEQLRNGLDGLLGADPGTLARLVDVVTGAREEWRRRMEHRPEECRPEEQSPDGHSSAGSRAPDWRNAIDGTMLELVRHGRLAEAKEHLSACRSSS